MQFIDFLYLVKKIVPLPPLYVLKKALVLQDVENLPTNHKELYWLAICESYKVIYHDFYLQREEDTFTNEYFFDFVTQTNETVEENTVVVHCGKDKYRFFVDELLKVFHNDLCRSNTILFEETAQYIDPTRGYVHGQILHNVVWSLQRSFRLPVNPWSNKTFTWEQIKEIFSQFLLLGINLEDNYPEVNAFLKDAKNILYLAEKSADSQQMSPFLQGYFEKKGLVFEEKIQPIWICTNCKKENNMDFTAERQLNTGECKYLQRGKTIKCCHCEFVKIWQAKLDCLNDSKWKSLISKNFSHLKCLLD